MIVYSKVHFFPNHRETVLRAHKMKCDEKLKKRKHEFDRTKVLSNSCFFFFLEKNRTCCDLQVFSLFLKGFEDFS